MKRIIWNLTLLCLLTIGGAAVMAQDAGTDDSTGPETTVNYFFIACEDEAVIDLNGFATPGFDIFYQVFNQAGAQGTALTALRRVNVDGDYAFSERIAYRDGQRVAPGAIASARVLIAVTETPDQPAFETVVEDVQDGCNDAANPLGSSDNAGDPVTEDDANNEFTSGIVSPDGGQLNPTIISTPQPEVVIGPRLSDIPAGRTANPGLVFASCNSFYPQADPGLIYDTDNIRVFWYWIADTPELLQQNLSVTNYDVKINGAPVHTVVPSAVQERNGAFYQFYEVPVGQVRPGYYEVSFRQTWNEAITDGFEEFGPGTPTTLIDTRCNFEVERNPSGANVTTYSGMYIGGDEPPSDFRADIVRQETIQNFLEQSNIGERDESEDGD